MSFELAPAPSVTAASFLVYGDGGSHEVKVPLYRESEGRIQRLQLELTEARHTIATRNGTIAILDGTIKTLESTIATQDGLIAKLESHILELAGTVDGMAALMEERPSRKRAKVADTAKYTGSG